MQTKTNRFDNYRFACYNVANIMTEDKDKKPLSEIQLAQIETYEARERDAENGVLDGKGKPTKPLTKKMKDDLECLKKRLNVKDELSKGAKTHCHNCAKGYLWNRKRIIQGEALEKGIWNEEAAFDLWREVTGKCLLRMKRGMRING